ncbi:hypothetical protein [Actibacterium sp. D379-3]
MADKKQDSPIDLGIYGSRAGPSGLTAADIIAFALSLLWLAASGAFFMFAKSGPESLQFGPITFVLTFVAIAMPVALIWVAASAAKSARVMREESARLQAAIDAMRHTYIQQQQSVGMGTRPTVEKKLDEIAAAQKQAESAMATFASSRARPVAVAAAPVPAVKADTDQPSLALGTPAEELSPPLPVEDFIRALNFPETADDQDGFRALRRALQDRAAAKLIRSAQDVLTLLSQDGIYMDDLRPDRARAEIWRRFATGERGAAVAGLGGVRDRSCLALTAGRMRQDPIFRDAAHHFLRQFDRTLTEFAQTASDQEISDLAETRTARAFMLLGRVSGTFD